MRWVIQSLNINLEGKIVKGIQKKSDQEEKFKKASDSLREIQKLISPFVKKRKIDSLSTAGKWSDVSSNYFFIKFDINPDN